MILRNFFESDFEDYYDIVSNDEIYKFLMAIKPTNKIIAFETFKNYMLRDNEFAIVENEHVVGYIRLDLNMYHKKASIGYVVNPRYQRRGYCSQAIEIMINKVFKEMGIEKIEATVFEDNLASANLLEKCGFKLEGIIRKELFVKDQFVDVKHYGIIKEEI